MATSKSSNNREPVRAAGIDLSRQSPLVSSPAMAKRESAKLRQGREQLKAEPSVAETVVRSSLI